MLIQIFSAQSIYSNSQQQQQHFDSHCSMETPTYYHPCLSLSFSNPPEPIYHVRYLSEITNSPLDGNIVNTRKKTKKNVSGRYLKGIHGRHVTIEVSHKNYVKHMIFLVDFFDITFQFLSLTIR